MEQAPRQESSAEQIEIIHKLQEYLRSGYVLHGSKRKLAILEPRQATDTKPERVVGKAMAIYAEDTDIRIPIFMALIDGRGHSGYSVHGGPDEYMEIHGDQNMFLSKGYIHVLPKDTFEEEIHANDRELISRVAVEPIDIIEIEPSILNYLEKIQNRMVHT